MYRDAYRVVKSLQKPTTKFSDSKEHLRTLFHAFNFSLSTVSVCPV